MSKFLVATRLETRVHHALKTIAEKRDRTISYLVRQAVERYVKEETRNHKDADKRNK